MVKTEEKLKKEVGKLYLFTNLMYGDVLDSIGKKKKTIGFEEERILEHIKSQLMNLSKAILRILKLTKSFLKILTKYKGNILLI